MSTQQRLISALSKHTPILFHDALQANISQTDISKLTEQEVGSVQNYLQSLQKHKEYLSFFQIGIHRDQKSKIQQVARYVGLAIRPPKQ